MEKSKIAVLATFFWPVSGDVEDYPYNITRILKETKQDFIVLTPNVWPDGSKIKRPLNDSFREMPIKRFPVYANITWFTKLWFPRFDEGTKIIHSCGGYRHPHMFTAFFRRGNAKFLLSPFYPMHPRENPLLKLAVWLIDSTLGRYTISHSACCFAETRQEAGWLRQMGAKKVVILPNSLPREAFERGEGKRFRKRYKIKGKMLFSLGRQVPIKNFEEIISVMPNLNATLVIGGEETGYTKECKELAKNLGVEKKVIWTGFMNSKQKREAYSACDVYVCSSIRESLGTSVIEAMAQGKPVIATNSGGLPEVVPDKFCMYRQGSKNELKRKILAIFNDKALSRKLSQKGRKKAENYRFRKMKKIYFTVINQLSQEKNAE